jgi:branched-chain amino acid transport system ATP-binding protein
MGLSPMLVERISSVTREVSERGISILLVEQPARLALEIAQRGYVMESGQISLSGAPSRLLHDPRVPEAYLGEWV